MNKKYVIGLMLLILAISAFFTGCNDGKTEAEENGNIVLASEVSERDNLEPADILGSEVGLFLLIDEKNNDYLNRELELSKHIPENAFSKMVGVYMEYTDNDTLKYVPVLSLCINDQEDQLTEQEVRQLYFPDNMILNRFDSGAAGAYYVVYARAGNGDITQLGIALTKSGIKKIDSTSVGKDESIDEFDTSFEFYPYKGVRLQSYSYAVTTSMSADDYRFSNYSASGEVMEGVSDEFVNHEVLMESLENGKEWSGSDVSSDYQNPVKINPFVTIHIKRQADAGNEISMSIKELVIKKSVFKKYRLDYEESFSAEYANHQFVVK